MISRDFFSVANNLGDSVAFNLESDNRKGLLLVSVAPFMENGEPAFRMQAIFLPWKTASKVLKLVSESSSER